MASDDPLEMNRAVPGGRVELFAVRNEEYPGGWFYRFQYYHPDEGEILRYDDAHDDDDLGWHHRHVRNGTDTEVEFRGIVPHLTRFFGEVSRIADASLTGAADESADDGSRHHRPREDE
jgi:hypothetical protein